MSTILTECSALAVELQIRICLIKIDNNFIDILRKLNESKLLTDLQTNAVKITFQFSAIQKIDITSRNVISLF